MVVTIVDDVPTISSVDADNDGKPDITFVPYPDVNGEDTPLSAGETADFTNYETSRPYYDNIWNGQVTITGGRVQYTYEGVVGKDDPRNVINVNIISSGTGLEYSSHITNPNITDYDQNVGLTVSGKAEISADRSYDDDGNFTGVATQSDAIIVKLPEGTVAYGLNLKLGAFFTESSSGGGTQWDTVPEQALLTFYKDGEIVLIYPITADSEDGSYTVPADLVITEGFDQVVISAVDNSWASKDNFGIEQSDFVVQEIGFVTLPPNEVMFRYEGNLVSNGGADGFADGYRFAFSDQMGESLQVKLEDGTEVTATLTRTEGDNGSSILLATVLGADGKTENLFSVTLDADGHWKFDQYQEFSMSDGSDFELGFMTKDNDGDKAYENVTLITTTETNIGTAYAPTPDVDVIVDGNSGHDNFVGDPGGATAGSETTTYPNLNVALVVDESGSMDDDAGDGSSRMEHMQKALKSLGSQLAEYVQGAPEGTTVDVALIGFAESASMQTFTVDQLTEKTAIQYEINGHYLSTRHGTQSDTLRSDGESYRIGTDGQLEIKIKNNRWQDTHDFDDSRTTITAFDHAVNNLDPDGGTSYASGFNAAKTWLKDNAVQSDGDKDVVLLVTDGFPGTYQTASSIQNGYKEAVTAYQGLVSAIPGLTVESIGIQLPAELPEPGLMEDGYPAGFPKTPEELLDSLTTDEKATNVTDISQLEGTFTDFIDQVISEGTVTPSANDVILGGRGNDMLFGDALNADYLLGDGYIWTGKEKYVQGSSWDIINAYLFATLGHNPSEGEVAKFIAQNADMLGLTDTVTDDTGIVRGGDDIILGGSGDDIIYGQGGNDLIFGDGSDTATSDSDIETLNTLDDLLTAAGADTGSSYADRIQGLEIQGSQDQPSDLDHFISSLEGAGGIEKDTDGNDQLFGGSGDDVIFGMGGDDYIDGGDGADTIFAGSGNDIIVYDSNDYLVDGGSGIDILISGTENTPSLDALLDGSAGADQPIVRDVEVLITGNDALGLTSMDKLAEYGITIGKEGDKDALILDSSKWVADGNDGTYTYQGDSVDLTLQTTIPSQDDTNDAAIQQQVLILQTSNS